MTAAFLAVPVLAFGYLLWEVATAPLYGPDEQPIDLDQALEDAFELRTGHRDHEQPGGAS